MILEVPREDIDTIMQKTSSETSSSIRQKVVAAREKQQHRFANMSLTANAHMQSRHIDQLISLDAACQKFLKQAANSLHLSARVVHRMIKLARTIADMNGSDEIVLQNLAEAMQYRSKSMFIEE